MSEDEKRPYHERHLVEAAKYREELKESAKREMAIQDFKKLQVSQLLKICESFSIFAFHLNAASLVYLSQNEGK